MIVFTVPLPCDPPQPNRPLHWAVKARMVKACREAVAIVGNSERAKHGWPAADGPRKVRMTLIRPSGRLLDSDGLSGACKPLRDALQPPRITKRAVHPGCSLIVMDSPAWVTFEYALERGPLAVRIEVSE